MGTAYLFRSILVFSLGWGTLRIARSLHRLHRVQRWQTCNSNAAFGEGVLHPGMSWTEFPSNESQVVSVAPGQGLERCSLEEPNSHGSTIRELMQEVEENYVVCMKLCLGANWDRFALDLGWFGVAGVMTGRSRQYLRLRSSIAKIKRNLLVCWTMIWACSNTFEVQSRRSSNLNRLQAW